MITLRDLCDSVTAYPIQDDASETGELDYINGGLKSLINQFLKFLFQQGQNSEMKLDKFAAISAALVRYSIAGNFLGLPAVTVPV